MVVLGFRQVHKVDKEATSLGCQGVRGYIYVKVHHDERLVVAGAVIYYDC